MHRHIHACQEYGGGGGGGGGCELLLPVETTVFLFITSITLCLEDL